MEVDGEQVTVSYVRAVLPGDETRAGAEDGEVSFTYTIEPRLSGF